MTKLISTLAGTLLVAASTAAFPQTPDWVVIDLSTPGLSSGQVGIGDDGTIGWIELNAGMAQVYRRTAAGEVLLVAEHIGTWSEVGGPRAKMPINARGDIVSFNMDPATNLTKQYVNGELANWDAGSQHPGILLDSRKLYSNTWTDIPLGNNDPRGDLVMYDVSTSTRTIYPISDDFYIPSVKTVTTDGNIYLTLQLVNPDPWPFEFHSWRDGVLTPVNIEGVPEGCTADQGSITADSRGSKLAYTYVTWEEPRVFVIVVKDLLTNDSSVLAIPRPEFGSWLQPSVDAQGRVIFSQRIFDATRFANGAYVHKLSVFNGSWLENIDSELHPMSVPRINDSGQIVYTRFPETCGIVDPNEPTCKADVFHYDLDTGQRTQVTDVPEGTFVWTAQINNLAEIVFMFTDQPTWSNALGDDPAYSVGAAIIDEVAPTVPSNLTATAISQSQIDLAWTESTDSVGLDYYEVLRNDIVIASVSSTTFRDTGLASDTTFVYHVQAVDLAGNRSEKSNPVTATTLRPQESSSGGGSFGLPLFILLGLYSLSLRKR